MRAKVPKKGGLGDCSNHRGIMLLSVPDKVLNRIFLERMKTAVDTMLRDQQAGFRKDQTCIDQICTLWVIIEQSLEWNSSLYINFVDYEKAFDSVYECMCMSMYNNVYMNVYEKAFDSVYV